MLAAVVVRVTSKAALDQAVDFYARVLALFAVAETTAERAVLLLLVSSSSSASSSSSSSSDLTVILQVEPAAAASEMTTTTTATIPATITTATPVMTNTTISTNHPVELLLVVAHLDVLASRLTDQGVPFLTRTTTELRVADPCGTVVVLRTPTTAMTTMMTTSQLDRSDGRAKTEREKEAKGKARLFRAAPSWIADGTKELAGERRKIAVLTSGGDCCGMNAAYRSIVRTGIHYGCDIFAVNDGYKGLIEGGSCIHQVFWDDVSGIIADGGTIIGTARCKEMRTLEGRLRAAGNLIEKGIDSLIVIGGDGSLTGANTLRREWPELVAKLREQGSITKESAEQYQNFRIAGLVGSIDNDMYGTDLTIGADSALHRIVEAIDTLSSTALSHQRVFVVEVMGRNCGWLALYVAMATDADWVFIPESPPQEGWEAEMCDSIMQQRKHGKRKSIIIVAEGAVDRFGKSIQTNEIRDLINQRLNVESRSTILGHVQRGGNTSSYDRVLASIQGYRAVVAILEQQPGIPSPLIGLHANEISESPLVECVKQTEAIGAALKGLDFNTAMQLRGTEFVNCFQMFMDSTKAFPKAGAPTSGVRIGIVHCGAPAGGMNHATRSIVRIAISDGHEVFGIHDGFLGLIEGRIEKLSWMSIDLWAMKGGSELGTSRATADVNMGMVAFNLQKHNINALVIIGGFEGFLSAIQLTKARSLYPPFCIPIVLLPATISNNVPGTELSLGSDTALNTIVQFSDQIKLSASSTSRRVFFVEVMGGNCGYLALMGSLGSGASGFYLPELGVCLDDIQRDLQILKKKLETSTTKGRIFLCNEKASDTFTTELMRALFADEGRRLNLFDCRTANLGHLQQGGAPSPQDRVRGFRLAYRSVKYLEQTVKASLQRPRGNRSFLDQLPVYTSSPDTACVIGISGGKVEFAPVLSLIEAADMKNRRPKSQWWMQLLPLVNIIIGHPGQGVTGADVPKGTGSSD